MECASKQFLLDNSKMPVCQMFFIQHFHCCHIKRHKCHIDPYFPENKPRLYCFLSNPDALSYPTKFTFHIYHDNKGK